MSAAAVEVKPHRRRVRRWHRWEVWSKLFDRDVLVVERGCGAHTFRRFAASSARDLEGAIVLKELEMLEKGLRTHVEFEVRRSA